MYISALHARARPRIERHPRSTFNVHRCNAVGITEASAQPSCLKIKTLAKDVKSGQGVFAMPVVARSDACAMRLPYHTVPCMPVVANLCGSLMHVHGIGGGAWVAATCVQVAVLEPRVNIRTSAYRH